MLSIQALRAAQPLADLLDSTRTVVYPVQGSPLAALCTATRSDSLFVTRDENNVASADLETIALMANTRNETVGFSDHDRVMDDLSDDVGDKVKGYINYARTVVKSAIVDMVQRSGAAIHDRSPVSELLGMEVVVWTPPAPMLNKTFVSGVLEYADIPFDNVSPALNLAPRSYEEIIKSMETGKTVLDQDIAAWAATKGQGFFTNLWNIFFQNQGAFNGKNVPTLFDFASDSVDGIDYTLAIHLLARRLVDDVPEGVRMSIQTFQTTMAQVRDQAGLRLNVFMKEIEGDAKSGRLIRLMDEKKTIVNEPVYKEWLNKGGSNEVLFGNMLSGRPVYTANMLDAAGENLRASWNRHEIAVSMAESNNSFSRNKAIVRAEFVKQLGEIEDEAERAPNNITVVTRLFDEELDRVQPKEFENLFDLCMKLVCRSRFYQTDAERILSAGERIKHEFPEVDVREAYAMATIEYIAYWVITMMKPTVL